MLSFQRNLLWTLLLLTHGTSVLPKVDSGEPRSTVPRIPVELVRQELRYGTTQNNEELSNWEAKNWRTHQWDERRLGGRLHAATQSLSLQKEAWHYYIRGVGPAIHERPPGRVCW
ncbi:MAG: hypothetical protein NTW75_07925 [Planctomycetales bacterium]|nr:hypothetical protein [Planctomycetales bacterium]